MKRIVILSAFAVFLTASSLLYFLWLRPVHSEQKILAEEPAQNSRTQNVIAAPGVVEAVSEETEIGAEIAGKLKSVGVEEGDRVTRGQIVAVLENADYAARVAMAQANVETLRRQKETAVARLGQAEADRQRIANGARREERAEAKAGVEQTLPTLENARREYERRRRLFDSGDVSREELERARRDFETADRESRTMQARFAVVSAAARADDLDKADAAIRLAATQIREFDAQIGEAQARVREAEAALAKTVVRAPFAGVILRKRLKDGESVTPESQTGIVTLADVSALRVRVDVDETDVAVIRPNQTAYVTADAYGERKFAARVVRVGQILGRKNFRTERPTERVDTKILEVLLELAPDEKLPLGLRVDAYIAAGN